MGCANRNSSNKNSGRKHRYDEGPCLSRRRGDQISQNQTQKQEKLLCVSEIGLPSGYYPTENRFLFSSIDRKKKLQQIGEYTAATDERGWNLSRGHRIVEVMGSCNGLLLIREFDDLFLWNPSIRYCKKVLSYHQFRDSDYSVVTGLCFDSHSNNYKAVFALAHETPSYGGEFVTVGSCKSKIWTHIHFPYRVSSIGTGPVFNNRLHWFASAEGSEHFMSTHCIIYFDASTDNFRRLAMPKPIESDGDVILGLGVLDGCLCMSRFEEPGKSEGTVQVLVMKEYGVKKSWALLFKVEGIMYTWWGGLVPYFYTEKKGEVLMKVSRHDSDDEIIAYDIDKKSSIVIEDLLDHSQDPIVYAKTSVTPTDYDWEDGHIEDEDSHVIIEKDLYGETRVWRFNLKTRAWHVDWVGKGSRSLLLGKWNKALR